MASRFGLLALGAAAFFAAVGFLSQPVQAAVTCDPPCGAISQVCQPDPSDPAQGICVAKNELTANYDPGGLVPCTTNCNFCDLFTLVERTVKLLFLKVVPAIAVIIVVIAGLLMITSAGNEGRLKTANGMLVNVIVGLAIIYSAWLVVHTVLSLVMSAPLGAPDVAKIVLPWNEIECRLGSSSTPQNPNPAAADPPGGNPNILLPAPAPDPQCAGGAVDCTINSQPGRCNSQGQCLATGLPPPPPPSPPSP